LRLPGNAVDAIVNANKEKYERYVCNKNGVKTINLQLLKTMYGTLTDALLWYQIFVETINDFRFEVNPYDE